MQLVVQPNGSIRCVYDEQFNLRALGTMSIQRGSHVEPTLDGQWTADLSPVAGPVLGPFTLRTAALAAERQWLEEHWLISADF